MGLGLNFVLIPGHDDVMHLGDGEFILLTVLLITIITTTTTYHLTCARSQGLASCSDEFVRCSCAKFLRAAMGQRRRFFARFAVLGDFASGRHLIKALVPNYGRTPKDIELPPLQVGN